MPENKTILFGPLPPPMGGVAVFMSYIAHRAAKLGVRIWSYKGKNAGDDAVEILQVNHRRFEHLTTLLREGYRARITDSTHFHLEHPHWLLLPFWLAAKFFLRFRWIKILHDGSLPPRYEEFNFLRRTLFKAAISQIDEFIVYDRDLEKWLRGKISADKKCHFIPVLLPFSSDWQKPTADEKLIAETADFAAREKRVCSIGVFIPNYGFHHVANAVEKLRAATGEDIGLLLVDGLFARDEDYRTRVLKNRDWITTVEKVPHGQLPFVFQQSQVFVRAFNYESYGLSRVEAIMCGVPVVATNVGETRGMFLYEYDDEATLAAHLENILSGDATADTEKWAEIYEREAEQNLENYLRVITGRTEIQITEF